MASTPLERELKRGSTEVLILSLIEHRRRHGYEIGRVDGPADSEYAQIDDRGRYRVKVLFDESDRSGDKASTWLRMMQPHAGSPEGMHFPLRKGTEVLLAFLRGDPDRPIIAGAVLVYAVARAAMVYAIARTTPAGGVFDGVIGGAPAGRR